jgi:putative ABC transport system substrate-binding protein
VDRRTLLAGSVWLLITPLMVEGQPVAKVPKIGYLSPSSAPPARNANMEAFREGLRELGWFEGQNLIVEYRFAGDQSDRLSDLATELVMLNVDVIVASGGTRGVVAAKNATGTIPIVMPNGGGDPVGLGLVASLSRPGGNVTGLSFSVGMDTFGKSLEFLTQAVPKVRRVAVLSNPGNPSHALVIRNVEGAARSMGLKLQLLEARGPDEFNRVFAGMVRARVGALLVVADAAFFLHRTQLADLTVKHRLPSMHGLRDEVEIGGLMSYGPSLVAQYRRAAVFVDKILKGAKPADLPVEQPTKFELVINLKTAKALGLTIPPAVLARADEVIHP